MLLKSVISLIMDIPALVTIGSWLFKSSTIITTLFFSPISSLFLYVQELALVHTFLVAVNFFLYKNLYWVVVVVHVF